MADESFLVGLTGPIGAGKSAVARVWRDRGARVVEGDQMGRLALESDAELRRRLVKRFGDGILQPDGRIDRIRLAKAAFTSPEGQRDLTRLTFPTLYRLARDRMAELSRQGRIVVFDAALIFEWDVGGDFDLLVTVTAPVEILIQRAAQRLGVDTGQAAARLGLQISPTEKADRADIVLINDGDLEMLEARAEVVWDDILRRADKDEG